VFSKKEQDSWFWVVAIMSEYQSENASPPKTDQLFEEGKTNYRSGQYERALALFDEALVLAPDDVNLHNWRGYTHRELGKLENALRDFSEVIRLSPSYAEAYCDRGRVLERQGSYDGAIADYDMAINISPTGEAFLFRGFANAQKGENVRALADYRQALAVQLSEEQRDYAEGQIKRLENPRKFELLDKYLRTVAAAPVLRTVNGVGHMIQEQYEDKDLSPKFFGFYFRTYFLPIVPPKLLAVYLVSRPVRSKIGRLLRDEYIFHGLLTPEEFAEIYPGVLESKTRSFYWVYFGGLALFIVIFLLVKLFK
jgi:tetratricopeptide (TPR) repeat protein